MGGVDLRRRGGRGRMRLRAAGQRDLLVFLVEAIEAHRSGVKPPSILTNGE